MSAVITLQVDGSPVVVEVDGPAHFLATPPYQPCGKTLLRNRLLAAGAQLACPGTYACPTMLWPVCVAP